MSGEHLMAGFVLGVLATLALLVAVAWLNGLVNPGEGGEGVADADALARDLACDCLTRAASAWQAEDLARVGKEIERGVEHLGRTAR